MYYVMETRGGYNEIALPLVATNLSDAEKEAEKGRYYVNSDLYITEGETNTYVDEYCRRYIRPNRHIAVKYASKWQATKDF